jgi:hypothetical protein
VGLEEKGRRHWEEGRQDKGGKGVQIDGQGLGGEKWGRGLPHKKCISCPRYHGR